MTYRAYTPSNASSDLTLYEVHTDLDIEGFEDIGMDGEPTGLKLTVHCYYP